MAMDHKHRRHCPKGHFVGLKFHLANNMVEYWCELCRMSIIAYCDGKCDLDKVPLALGVERGIKV